jgi:hypothetical protein
MEHFVALHPENEQPRRLARRIILDHACTIQAGDACDTDEHESRAYLFFRWDLANHQLLESEALIQSQSDEDLGLVFQAMLDLHLRMAVDWMHDLDDFVLLQRAASPDYLYSLQGDLRPNRSEMLARQLVAARHAIAVDEGLATTFALVERELRQQWVSLCRDARLHVVQHLALLGGRVAVERSNHSPLGRFGFLEDD